MALLSPPRLHDPYRSSPYSTKNGSDQPNQPPIGYVLGKDGLDGHRSQNWSNLQSSIQVTPALKPIGGKAKDLIASPAFIVLKAADRFRQLWTFHSGTTLALGFQPLAIVRHLFCPYLPAVPGDDLPATRPVQCNAVMRLKRHTMRHEPVTRWQGFLCASLSGACIGNPCAA